ncbi:ras guanine nucleotide exchange factor domain-containing protein [Chytriomyces cf. hyalinus JEL632]|nr:ras guanine nucleotide exchange factor domain-containing protein [Chytriomyces cf. hyalinus JEL632]
MKSLKKSLALERDSTLSMRSSFLTVIGKRRNIRDSPIRLTTAGSQPYATHASLDISQLVVQYLVKSGADMNARMGACTALMVACWMRRFDVVQVLVGGRSAYDKEMGDWVRSGLRKPTRMSGVFWSEDVELQGRRLVSLVTREGLRKDANLLSSEDMEDARIISILKAYQPVVALTQEVDEVGDGVVFDFDQITEQGGEARFQTIDLTEKLPTRRTELDESFLQVCKCVILLAMAANKHDKATYFIIAAKQIRQSSNLLSLVDCMRADDRSSKDYCHQRPNLCSQDYAGSSHVCNKMACGIRPPANALAEMIQAASHLSKARRLLTELANLTGFYPVLEKVLVLKKYHSSNTAKALLGTMDSETQATRVTPSTSFKHISRAYLSKGIIKIFSLGVDASAVFSDATRILEVDALEFAKHLTLFGFDEFALVRPSECLDQIWSANIETERAAAKLQLSLWIATTILSCANIKILVLLLRYFAQCAIKCRELSNYNGITGIVAGLSMAPIARLHKTWRKFGKYYSSILSDYEASASIVSPKGQYAKYWKELKDIKLPAISFLGKLIAFVRLATPYTQQASTSQKLHSSTSEILNSSHVGHRIHQEATESSISTSAASLIKEIQKFQAVQFVHAPVDWMQDIFARIGEVGAVFNGGAVVGVVVEQNLGLAVGNEDSLYTQSLVVEPREEEEDDDESDGKE